MDKHSTVSVVLATYNEEDNLASCLDSVKDLAGEIVIVDGGSKDKTLDIARQFNAKVIQTDNPPIFHINKNKAIDAATGDWVLQLDADEIVTKDLADEIKKTINFDLGINGYWLPRRNFFLGRFLTKGGQYPDYTLRLYRRGTGRLPAKDVHEQAQVSGKVGYLKNDLLHLRDKVFSEYIKRFNRYTDLLASQLKDKNISINILSFVSYVIIRPVFWFLKVFIRHKGFVDGFPGFVFAFFSSLRFPISYFKLWKLYGKESFK
ncbi:MAG: glycosyltransferase family 2 protein [Candidatus Daviesbacteria bacterium]|nr:glycosyltransferase family 2 protein [Candidatus Daviesbacteria bacterium]